MWCTHTHTGILLNHRKEWNNAIFSKLGGPRDCRIKWKKSETERQPPYGITYIWTLKKWYKGDYLQNRHRPKDIEENLW